MIIGTLIVSTGEHVSSADPAIELFDYLRHSLVGRGVFQSPGANALEVEKVVKKQMAELATFRRM